MIQVELGEPPPNPSTVNHLTSPVKTKTTRIRIVKKPDNVKIKPLLKKNNLLYLRGYISHKRTVKFGETNSADESAFGSNSSNNSNNCDSIDSNSSSSSDTTSITNNSSSESSDLSESESENNNFFDEENEDGIEGRNEEGIEGRIGGGIEEGIENGFEENSGQNSENHVEEKDQVSQENTKPNVGQKYNILYDLATNDGDTMNDFLIDIMEEIEAENITVEECAEALEKSGHLTIDEVLQIYAPGPAEDKIQKLLDILTNVGIDTLKRCRDSILLSMCTLPSLKDFLMAQDKLEQAEEDEKGGGGVLVEMISINDRNKSAPDIDSGKNILPRLETPERKNKSKFLQESSDSAACNLFEVDLQSNSADTSLASMQSNAKERMKRTDSVDSEVSQKSAKSVDSQKSSSSAATIADSIDNSILSSKMDGNSSQNSRQNSRQSSCQNSRQNSCQNSSQNSRENSRKSSLEKPQISSNSSMNSQNSLEIEELLISASLEASDENGDSSSLNQTTTSSDQLSHLQITDQLINSERQMLIDLEHRSKLRKLIQPETLKALLPILLDIGVVRAKQVWTLMNHQNEELKVKELEGILGLVEEDAMESNGDLREILELCGGKGSVNTTIKRNKLGVGLSTSSSSDDDNDRMRFRAGKGGGKCDDGLVKVDGQKGVERSASFLQSRIVKTALTKYQRTHHHTFMPNSSVCNKPTNKNSSNFTQKNPLHTPFRASTLVDKSLNPEKTVTFEKTGCSDSDTNQRVSVLRKTSFNSKQATPVLKRHDSFTKVINQAPMHPPSRQNRVIVELIRKLQNENKLNEGKLSQVGNTNVRTTIERFRKNEQLKMEQLEKKKKLETNKLENNKLENNKLETNRLEPDTNETIDPTTPISSKPGEIPEKTHSKVETIYADEPPDTIFDTICCATSKLSNLSSITTVSFNEMDILSDDSLSTDDDDEFVDSLILNSPKMPRKDVLKDPGELIENNTKNSEISETDLSGISSTVSMKNNSSKKSSLLPNSSTPTAESCPNRSGETSTGIEKPPPPPDDVAPLHGSTKQHQPVSDIDASFSSCCNLEPAPAQTEALEKIPPSVKRPISPNLMLNEDSCRVNININTSIPGRRVKIVRQQKKPSKPKNNKKSAYHQSRSFRICQD